MYSHGWEPDGYHPGPRQAGTQKAPGGGIHLGLSVAATGRYFRS
jgi:hypothetical protein